MNAKKIVDRETVYIPVKNLSVVTIPMEMTQEDAAEVAASLARSVELISKLMTRLIGRGEDQ